MASRQNAPAKKPGGWGSLLSGAVAGLESRLDTILANEEAAGETNGNNTGNVTTKPASRPERSTTPLAVQQTKQAGASREGSRTRANDRLAERLAKATAAKPGGGTGSAVPSRTSTPANERQSGEESRDGGETVRSVPGIVEPEPIATHDGASTAETLERSEAPGTPPPADGTINLYDESRPSADHSRSSIELSTAVSTRPSSELANGSLPALVPKSAAEYEAELHTYMEKIDALQAKLSYLANSTVAAAKTANASPDTSTIEKQLAEKDEQIALLMQEGEKLSKAELKHLQTIKKQRAQRLEDDKSNGEAKRKWEKVEAGLRQKLKALEQVERDATEKKKAAAGLEKEVEKLRVEREATDKSVTALSTQLKEARARAEKAELEAKEKGTSETDKGRIASLENDLEDAQIEKKLAEDRAAAEIKKAKEDFEGQRQRFDVRELELKNEIAGLESRMEALRSRAEEEGVTGTGESNLQLLRQVETLQRQYAMAKGNWEAIEASLNGRLAAVEKERDESSRREAEVRKRLRELGLKTRRLEDEMEGNVDESNRQKEELETQSNTIRSLQERCEQSQKALEDAQVELVKQKRVWEVQTQQRVEEEKAKWSHQSLGASNLRNQSPMTGSRKMSTTDVNALHSTSRRPGLGIHTHSNDPSRPTSRRSSGHPAHRQSSTVIPSNSLERSVEASPSVSRPESLHSLTTAADIPPTPSFEIHNPEMTDPFNDSIVETPLTPDDGQTLADLLSTSTAPATGPSVQLVERMSQLVRRLESEKATFKDEIQRLSTQRDSAREEVVQLMREAETKRNKDKSVEDLDGELHQLKRRYDASLEMLGEREEEVEELKSDLVEMKRLYKELVERKIGQ